MVIPSDPGNPRSKIKGFPMMFELSEFETTFWANLTLSQDSSNLKDQDSTKNKK
jgi:hypothetical protein